LISKICDRVLGAKWSIAMQLCSLHLKVWSLYWDNHWIICALESAMALCTLNGLTARFDFPCIRWSLGGSQQKT
jgi:hypothetical protein